MLTLPAIRFVVILVAAYGAWYLLYDVWLLPDGRLDYWLGVGLAALIAELLGSAGLAAHSFERVVWIEGTAGVEVVEGCTALTLVGMFLGLSIAFPGSWRDRLWFIPCGIALIMAFNFWRIAGLVVIQHTMPRMFEPAHDILFSAAFYVLVFGLWVLWIEIATGGAKARRPAFAAA